MKLVVYSDGSARARRAGAGVSIRDERGYEIATVVQGLTPMKSVDAEYEAARLGLDRVASLGANFVELRTDCDAMGSLARQGAIGWKTPRNVKLREQLQRLFGPNWHHVPIPRSENWRADMLADAASLTSTTRGTRRKAVGAAGRAATAARPT